MRVRSVDQNFKDMIQSLSIEPVVLAKAFHRCAWEAEAGRFLEFQPSLVYRASPRMSTFLKQASKQTMVTCNHYQWLFTLHHVGVSQSLSVAKSCSSNSAQMDWVVWLFSCIWRSIHTHVPRFRPMELFFPLIFTTPSFLPLLTPAYPLKAAELQVRCSLLRPHNSRWSYSPKWCSIWCLCPLSEL